MEKRETYACPPFEDHSLEYQATSDYISEKLINLVLAVHDYRDERRQQGWQPMLSDETREDGRLTIMRWTGSGYEGIYYYQFDPDVRVFYYAASEITGTTIESNLAVTEDGIIQASEMISVAEEEGLSSDPADLVPDEQDALQKVRDRVQLLVSS